LKIKDRLIGEKYPPFIIAEMSGNHNRSLDKALEIVTAAAEAGVHAVKLQTYTADTITIDSSKRDFYIDDPDSLWQGKTLYELYQQSYTPWEWHETIFKRCHELGLIAFSTPFDETAVDFLEGLDVPAYKIASFENNHLPLIRKAASTGKPIIISTGMSNVAELNEMVRTVYEAGSEDLVLLKCTSSYPASPEDSNLLTIGHLKKLFGTEVGLSDHTCGIGVSVAAVALGATVIEKHFTLTRSDGGVDSAFSMEPDEMKMLVEETGRAWQALGEVSYGPTKNEEANSRLRRSIYVIKDIEKGEEFTMKNISIIRPGDGLIPKYYESVLGETASCNIERGSPMRWDFIQKSS